GAGAGGGGGGGGSGIAGRVDPYRLATHESPRQQPPSPGQAQAPRRSLQVDISQKAGGRSPAASPDRGSAATSPYSVPQIAPMPSSRLCPVCNTTDLTASQDQPNFNTCTQCHAMVCNQCGFNPNPHLTEVQEWLCLNCQMQRALGMDMTTPPRSKSQQQIHSPSHQAKPEPQAQHPSQAQPSQPSAGPHRQTGPSQAQPTLDPLGRRDQPGLAKAPSQPDLSRSSPQHRPSRPAGTDQVRSAGSSPARAPGGPQEPSQDGLTGKLFGFGASLLNQASTLISVDPQPSTQPQQSPAKASPKVVFSDASSAAAPKPQGAMPGATQAKQGGTPPLQQQQQRQPPPKQDATPKPKEPERPKVSCPLCKTELNMGSAQPPNYNSCTQCGSQVCNLCGFNPTPHLLEKKEWLCLNCQTQRLLSGGLGDAPLPVPQPSPKHQPAGSPRHQPTAARQPPAPTQTPQKGTSPQHGPKAAPPQQKLPASAGSGPFSPAKHHAAPAQDKPAAGATGEAQKQQLLAEKDRVTPRPGREADTPPASKDSKPAPKKGAPEPITAITPAKESKKPGESQKTRHHDLYHQEALKSSTQDLSRSPQSLSDTGYSSDGISSSQSEITGLIHEEEMKLSERGAGEHSPPSPSEITKLESSMRPLLESKSISDGDQKGRGKQQHHHHDPRDDPKQKQRPRSLSITPEAFDSDEELEDILEEDEDSAEWENQHARRDSLAESSDDFGSKLRHDYVEMTDEEFMRRQILEMSAEEDNMDEDEGYGYPKQKKSHKHSTDSGKDSKRHLPHNSSSLYEEEVKVHEDGYKAAVEDGEEDLMASQGGLRRFKTIELNNTNSYSREMELSSENDLSLDREPELEMESLTGSPDERSRGEYSSTLPATTPSYTSGTSPTSVSSMEEDSDSSPSRRQRLEEAKQQRKARHRSHGPLLPTIEDSSEEEELREEEELLREQEKMREVEQQRIRSTARKTKRDKEELRAQRRRERSKTPPSNLSPIEDASPTEELRQAAEMEELHRSSCSEYSPSIDSEAEGFEMIASKLYKSGSEYNLPTFMSLYSPTEKPTTTSSSSSSKPLKSAEEVYEEMMRKAEMLQKQQKQQMQHVKQGQQYSNTYQQEDFRSTGHQNNYQYQYEEDYGYEKEMGTAHPGYQSTASKADNIYEEILQTSQSISKMQQSSSLDMSLQQKETSQTNLCGSFQDKQLLDTGSAFAKLLEQNSALLTPGTSPTQLSAPVSFSSTGTETSGTGARAIPDVRVTQHFSKEMQKDRARSQSSSVSVGSAAVTTVASYVVYGRESTATTHTSTGQTAASTSPSAGYGRQTGSAAGSAVSSRISEYAQAYSQRDSSGKRAGESKGTQVRDSSQVAADNVNFTSKVYSYFKGSSPPLSPYTSPTQSPTHSPSRMATAEFSTQTFSSGTSVPTTGSGATSPVVAQGTQTPHRSMSPRLSRQQSSQESPFMVITLGSEATSPSKPLTVNSSTSPLSSPTRLSRQQTLHGYGQSAGPPPSPQHQQQQQQQSQHVLYKTQTQTDRGPVAKVNVGTSTVTTANTYSRGSLSMENISLCRISTVPGTSRVEQGQRMPSGSVVDLRTATKPAPVIMTDQGMDLTSVASESRKFSVGSEASPTRHSTTVQPLIINLNAQQHPRVAMSTATTVSITVAASMFISQPKQPVVYGDPFQNRLDFGQGSGSAVCLTQGKKQTDQLIPKIDAKLEDLGTTFARYNLANQVQPLHKKDMMVSQTNTAQAVVSSAPPLDLYSGVPLELKGQPPIVNLSGVKPHVMMVQLDNASQGATVTQLVKPGEAPDALDLTGIKSENQVACCDVVYKFPFGGSCTGPFAQKPKSSRPPSAPQYYGSRAQEASQENYQYREQLAGSHGLMDERKPYPLPFPGRLHPSMSDTNLAEAGLHYYQTKTDTSQRGPVDMAVDLSTMKQSYGPSFSEGGYFGLGMQYGSYTDLRHQGDMMSQPLPIRRYSSLSNINADYSYSSRDLSSFQESNLAQYSATTAREISRMCAALNSIDQFGGRFGTNPELMQYGSAGGGASGSRFGLLSGQQGLPSMKANLMYGSNLAEGRMSAHVQSQASLAQYNARQASIRAMYPSAVRAADGMIYSTINTPIASTLPITTQPASVLRPMLRGLYRPYPTGNMTAVPLASLTRLPLVTPRMPLSSQGPYRYPPPNRFPVAPAAASVAPAATALETPVYLGKPSVTSGVSSAMPLASSVPVTQPTSHMGVPNAQAGAAPTTALPMAQPVVAPAVPGVAAGGTEKEKEEERLRRQQEHLLQFERERVELEKLRQMRLQEELERERLELQRHREKEQLLVQREIQELQTIKQQVLQQQQVERETQLVMQREQLAQQKMQLDQIQSLQQQLQQQLEEQKRQKAAAAAATPFIEGGVIQGVMPPRPLPSSASEMSLRNEEHMEVRAMKKRNSMPRLRDGGEFEENQHSVKRIADSSVQTDDEDGEERFYMSRRRRTRRIVDCSVQTDDEDNGEWEQPVRRRRSRFSKHSDSGSESKADSSKGTSSIAIQTISDCSSQTEPDQLGRVSPAIHITTHDPKVEIVHYISAPERTQKGESLACQTEPEAQSQGVVVPQLTVPTTVTPYSTNIQLVGSGPVDPLSPRLQGVAKFEKRKPDPLEIGYQSHHLHNESLSNLIRQPPKSPQVLYSPVSPLSPHRLLETSFSSSERLNKAHVTPQKHFTAESPQRQQTLPRPIKTMQRSMSDPKPISPTTEDPAKAKFSLYQQQALQNSQLSALQQNTLIRKVKRTLPSPPPEEAHLPVVTLPLPQMYAPTMPQKAGPRPVQANKASLLKDITHELKVVEQESTKLRKQQAELEEEEKEIDAKLRYLELGITQRKETLLKERERRELAYMRCMGDTRDYMSDSELNNMRIATTYEAQYPPTTSFVTYQYPQTQTAPQATTTYQQTGFQPPQYPLVTNAQPQPNTFQTHHPPPPYQTQGTFQPHNYTPNQPYQPDLGVQNHPGFQPPPAPYQTQATYPSQTSYQPGQNIPFQPQAEILTVHQKPRQTSLADLEQKMPTNYEVISHPTVVVTSAGQEMTYTPTTVTNNYGQYKPPETTLSDRINTAESPTSAYSSEGLYTNLEQNIPRNYVMIDDISELTKENVGTSSDMQKADIHGHPTNGRYGKDRCDTGENGSSARVSSYSRAEEESEEDLYDHHGRSKNSSSYHQRGGDSHSRMGSSSSGGGGSSYYYDDYKHSSRSSDKHGSSMGIQKHSSKNLAPAVVSSKRSKHRKQSMEQKISKFSPIEEAKDVESDMASYTITTSSGGSCNVMTRAKKLQDEITYGLKKNVYDQQKYYGMSSREALEEDDHIYSTGRSRSTGYGMDKISSRDSGNHRSKSYERDTMERSQRGSHSRGRPSMRSQHSEEESPLSPLGKPMGVGRGSGVPEPPDSRNQFGSSHSLPDVQDHMKDIPRSHAYKPDDAYIIDDMHCAVSDSEAYHLGQEETDWFEKPRELRSERSRHYSSGGGGGGGHSSSQRRNHVKHTYHDYDEPPDEDLWQQDDYSHPRHSSSSSREHRHHGSNSGRHSSSSRHSSEEARSSRSSKGHPKESSVRHESRQAAASSSQKRSQPADSRSLQGYHSSDYSRQPSSHHHGSSEGQRVQKQPPSSHHQQPQQQQQQQPQQPQSSRKQDHQAASSRQPPSSQPQPSSRQPQAGRLPASKPGQAQPQAQVQAQAQAQAPAPAQAQARPPQAGLQPAAAAKTNLADAAKPGVKPAAQPAKAPQGPTTAIGAKAAPRPGGAGGAAAGQAAADGESVFSKILPGGAAEQAGKLGEAVSAFGKKFTSFW
uniref:Bassoon presynaptic cytomatrix protein n=1 Tax=Lepisosteus oculatus TaxID=7918 RepID=W5NA51_LEPOC